MDSIVSDTHLVKYKSNHFPPLWLCTAFGISLQSLQGSQILRLITNPASSSPNILHSYLFLP